MLRVDLIICRPGSVFVLRGRQCLVSAQGQSWTRYVSLSFLSSSLSLSWSPSTLHIFTEPLRFPPHLLPVSNPLLHTLSGPLHFLLLFTVSGEVLQLRKCCETSDCTSCRNQYISGPADAALMLHRHTLTTTRIQREFILEGYK